MKLLFLFLFLQSCAPQNEEVFYPDFATLNQKKVNAGEYEVNVYLRIIVFKRGESQRTCYIKSQQSECLGNGVVVQICDCEEYLVKIYRHEGVIFKIEAATTEAELVLVRKALE